MFVLAAQGSIYRLLHRAPVSGVGNSGTYLPEIFGKGAESGRSEQRRGRMVYNGCLSSVTACCAALMYLLSGTSVPISRKYSRKEQRAVDRSRDGEGW